MSRFNAKATLIELFDGAGVTLELRPTNGDFSCSNLFLDGNAETMEARHRGTHDGFYEGDDTVQEWTMTLEMENKSLTHASESRIYDWIVNHRKGATNLTNIETSGSGRWASGVRVTCNDGTRTAVVTLPKTTAAITQFAEAGMEAHKFTLAGKNVVAPTVT